MNFKYLSFSDKLSDYIKNNEDTIYIFRNNRELNLYKNNDEEKDIFKKDSLFFTMSQFREQLFTTNKFVLKEEKRTLLFYEAISTQLKKEKGIKSYYDIIDYAENFLNFYRELREYKVEKLSKLEAWQEKSYEELEVLKFRYEELLDKYNYTTPDRIFHMDNFSTNIFSTYKNIIFVNIINFTPFEREFIGELKKKFNIDFLLQMPKGDFDEENLKFKSLNLGEFLGTKINICEVSEKNFQILDSIKYLDEDSNLISCDFDNLNYDKLLNQELISKNSDVPLSEVRIFKFLSLIHSILDEKEKSLKTPLYKSSTFLLAFEDEDFRKYFNLSDFDYDYFMKIYINENVKYITSKEIEFAISKDKNISFYTKFQDILNFLDEVSQLETLKDIVDFLGNLEKFNYIFFDQEEYEDLIPKYFEVLSEILSIEMLEYKPNWALYFEDVNTSLLLLLLKYMRHKNCTKLIKGKYQINNYDDYANIQGKLIILDASASTLPKKRKVDFLLSDKQKKENKLSSSELNRELERYYFFQKIFTNEEVRIYSLKNEDKNIDSSPFVEELILNYKVNYEKYKASQANIFIKNFFENKEDFSLETDELDNLKKTKENLCAKSKFIKLGSYTFSNLEACAYNFYLSSILDLEKYPREMDYKLDNRIIGIIIHEALELIADKKQREILQGDYTLSEEVIKETFTSVFQRKSKYIPRNYRNYYSKIMFPIFIEGIKNFYNSLEAKIEFQELTSFAQEKSKELEIYKEKDIEFLLSARTDLIIETQGKNYIIDYKTGGGKGEQLDFYSIVYYGEGDRAEKYIYNAWESKWIEKEDKGSNTLMKEDVVNTIKSFVADKIYRRTEKQALCKACNYVDICRMRWEGEE